MNPNYSTESLAFQVDLLNLNLHLAESMDRQKDTSLGREMAAHEEALEKMKSLSSR